MHVVYDLQACQTDSRDRGIGRYAYNLVESMLHSPNATGRIQATIALDGTDTAGRLREARNALRHGKFNARTTVYSYPRQPDATRDQEPVHGEVAARLRGRFFEALAPDAFLQLSHFETNSNYTTEIDWLEPRRVPSIAVAYDVIPLLYPERYLPAGEAITDWYRKKCESFARYDHFLAISQATRSDLIDHLGVAPERISVIGAGLDSRFLALAAAAGPDDVEWLKEVGITQSFILVGSNQDWRKNTLGALEAFARLSWIARKRHLIVLTQVGGDVHEALNGPLKSIAGQVRILGKVSDAHLATLYRRCELFLFPSYYEGFGLPLLEAMAFGAAVLSSNRGSLPEVVHRQDGLFDPCDPTQMADQLKAALASRSLRDSLRQGAREHAQKFQWKACAERALQAISQVAGGGAASPRNALRGQVSVESADISSWVDFLVATNEPDDFVKLENGIRAIAAKGIRRILVDVTTVAIDDARTGIQRVVRNFARGLAAVSEELAFDLRLIRWSEAGVFYANSYAKESLGLPMSEPDSLLEVQVNDLLFMVDSSWNNPGRFDALNAAVWAKGGEVVWMVYDLIPLLHPQTCHPGMPPAFEFWLNHVTSQVDGFVCISDATRADLERYIDAHGRFTKRPWTRFVHLGSDLDPVETSEPTAESAALLQGIAAQAFLLAIGTVEPRKDHATILSAFELLWAEGSNCLLVIVGKQGWNVEALAEKIRGHKELHSRLFWFENLVDQDLSFLLPKASALIQASLAEGFGLPIIEAGALGVPLLLSDIAVFHEVAGAAAGYFPAGDAKGLAKLIRAGLEHGFYRPRPGDIAAKTWRDVSTDLAHHLLTLSSASI